MAFLANLSSREAYFPSRHAGVSSDAVGRVFGGAELS